MEVDPLCIYSYWAAAATVAAAEEEPVIRAVAMAAMELVGSSGSCGGGGTSSLSSSSHRMDPVAWAVTAAVKEPAAWTAAMATGPIAPMRALLPPPALPHKHWPGQQQKAGRQLEPAAAAYPLQAMIQQARY